MMKKLSKLMAISTTLFFIFSCTGGSNGGGGSLTSAVPEIPDARTVPSVKTLQVNSDQLLCGSSFSSALNDNQMLVKVLMNNDKTFTGTFMFYDKPCSASEVSGDPIATYNVSGIYAVTDFAGRVVLTVTNSSMTILAGDYPAATKKFVDWMNSCSDMEGSFSSTENTTLSLALGPKCDASVSQAFSFVRHGGSQETNETALNRLSIANPQ